MRIITTRRQEEADRTLRLLRKQLADARAETRVQATANGRLAACAETVQAELQSTCAALSSSHRELIEQIDRLQGQVRMLQRDRDGLRRQLDHALGYDTAELALIAAGPTKTTGAPDLAATA
ncbi:hypothetical protein ACIQF6_14925 [Kitasatospora sp. NPDC092948]|uniref:hypothetical protein n=1 Tax=Kitasatospora sp. NPDC092948 TaxID=3364088 RepID=UPI0038065C44